MVKINKRIEIVSTNRLSLSSMSQPSREAARVALSAVYSDVRISMIDDLTDLKELVARQPDLVFLGMKYLPLNPALGRLDTKRVWLSQFLDEHGIAYTGSAQLAHSLEENKPAAKQLAHSAGLATAAFIVVKRGEGLEIQDNALKYPLFVKPTDRGGGVGVDDHSLVYNHQQLSAKISKIDSLRSDALIEEYLPGREFSVALLKNEVTSELDIMPLEISAEPNDNGQRILGHQAKTANHERVLAVADQDLKQQLGLLAKEIFMALDGRDYGRVDIRLDEQGTPHFLEVNLLPSLIEGYGNFPKACMLNNHLGYGAMLQRIVRLGLARQVNEPLVDPLATLSLAT